MAGLSGIVKKISDLVTGTPADDDCFVFGKSDLKKISWESIKSLVIARTIVEVDTALGITARFYKRSGIVFCRVGGYITKDMPTDGYEQICTIPEGYRPPVTTTMVFPQSAAIKRDIYFQMDSAGAFKTYAGTEIASGSAINFCITYVTA